MKMLPLSGQRGEKPVFAKNFDRLRRWYLLQEALFFP
jgi:hypothetical protein